MQIIIGQDALVVWPAHGYSTILIICDVISSCLYTCIYPCFLVPHTIQQPLAIRREYMTLSSLLMRFIFCLQMHIFLDAIF
jgi:hypothetical protein